MCGRGRGELHPSPHRSEHVPVQDGTIADGQHLSGQGLEVGHERLGPLHRRLGEPDDPAGHRPVQGREHLLATAVDHGGDRALGVPDRVGDGVDARDRDQRRPGDLGQRLRGLNADAQTGEQPRADADGEPTDLPEVGAGPGEQLLEGGRDAFLARLPGDLDAAEDRGLGADRDRDLGRRGVDADDDQEGATP